MEAIESLTREEIVRIKELKEALALLDDRGIVSKMSDQQIGDQIVRKIFVHDLETAGSVAAGTTYNVSVFVYDLTVDLIVAAIRGLSIVAGSVPFVGWLLGLVGHAGAGTFDFASDHFVPKPVKAALGALVVFAGVNGSKTVQFLWRNKGAILKTTAKVAAVVTDMIIRGSIKVARWVARTFGGRWGSKVDEALESLETLYKASKRGARSAAEELAAFSEELHVAEDALGAAGQAAAEGGGLSDVIAAGIGKLENLSGDEYLAKLDDFLLSGASREGARVILEEGKILDQAGVETGSVFKFFTAISEGDKTAALALLAEEGPAASIRLALAPARGVGKMSASSARGLLNIKRFFELMGGVPQMQAMQAEEAARLAGEAARAREVSNVFAKMTIKQMKAFASSEDISATVSAMQIEAGAPLSAEASAEFAETFSRTVSRVAIESGESSQNILRSIMNEKQLKDMVEIVKRDDIMPKIDLGGLDLPEEAPQFNWMPEVAAEDAVYIVDMNAAVDQLSDMATTINRLQKADMGDGILSVSNSVFGVPVQSLSTAEKAMRDMNEAARLDAAAAERAAAEAERVAAELANLPDMLNPALAEAGLGAAVEGMNLSERALGVMMKTAPETTAALLEFMSKYSTQIAKAGKVTRSVGDFLMIAGVVIDAVGTVTNAIDVKNYRKYIEEHPNDPWNWKMEQRADWAAGEARRSGVNTATGSAIVAAFLLGGPVGILAGLVGTGASMGGNARYTRKKHDKYLKEWYGSAKYPDFDYYVTRRDDSGETREWLDWVDALDYDGRSMRVQWIVAQLKDLKDDLYKLDDGESYGIDDDRYERILQARTLYNPMFFAELERYDEENGEDVALYDTSVDGESDELMAGWMEDENGDPPDLDTVFRYAHDLAFERLDNYDEDTGIGYTDHEMELLDAYDKAKEVESYTTHVPKEKPQDAPDDSMDTGDDDSMDTSDDP